MHEIIEATFELIDELEKSDITKNLVFYKNKVLTNKELHQLIEKGKNTTDQYLILDIKRRLYNNSDYKNYITAYNQLFYIVMNINQKYKKLLNTKICNK